MNYILLSTLSSPPSSTNYNSQRVYTLLPTQASSNLNLGPRSSFDCRPSYPRIFPWSFPATTFFYTPNATLHYKLPHAPYNSTNFTNATEPPLTAVDIPTRDFDDIYDS
ncbi:hypothetical protein PTI98_000819 [Pleurotus ostreatus]|nr:hypothetical protein PTI98_000819 [Pleurotus ostreatus]